jgi:hypothetical protein
VAAGDGSQFLLEVLHGVVASRLHPTPHRTRAHHATTIPAQQPRRRGKRHKDRKRTAQALEFPTRPLMRLHSQHLIERGDLRDGTALGTAAAPALPSDKANQAHHLARGHALTPHGRPAGRAGRPGSRLTRPLSEDVFDEADGQNTGDLPRSEDERREGAGVFHHAQQTLHRRIIMAYAVGKV